MAFCYAAQCRPTSEHRWTTWLQFLILNRQHLPPFPAATASEESLIPIFSCELDQSCWKSDTSRSVLETNQPAYPAILISVLRVIGFYFL